MSISKLHVIEAGLFTTVQDGGRFGYQRYGVPVGGAMDPFAYQSANALLGNDSNAAVLEMTVLGARIKFEGGTVIAITGANLNPVLNGEPVPMWQQVAVTDGSELMFLGVADGMRGYLAVAGGIDVPLVMDSRSTYVKSQIGGLDGRQIAPGDRLSTLDSELLTEQNYMPDDFAVPQYGHSHEVRIVFGPQDDRFTDTGVSTLLSSEYTVSMQSDRMGYRLEGPTIEHISGPDIVSDGTAFGSVQIPGDGQPIILLADRGITGGYTKIATVITTDLSKFAQAMPGDSIRFSAVSVEEAHEVLRLQSELISRIESPKPSGPPEHFSILVEGENFSMTDATGSSIAPSELESESSEEWSRRARVRIGGHTYEFEVSLQRID